MNEFSAIFQQNDSRNFKLFIIEQMVFNDWLIN